MTSHFVETRARSLSKTILWRCMAVLNSFTILTWMPESRPIIYAVTMNITGFFLFYFFERGCNLVRWGRMPSESNAETGS